MREIELEDGDGKETIMQKVTTWFLIFVFSSSLTFGATEFINGRQIATQLAVLSGELPHIKESIVEVRNRSDAADSLSTRAIAELRQENQEQIRNVADLMKELVKQNMELISLIRAQHQVKP